MYGAEAGNLALKTMAIGGIFLGGGISPKILSKLIGPLFMNAFLDKGRLRPLLEAIPVQVITNDKAGLLGAARCAAYKMQSRSGRELHERSSRNSQADARRRSYFRPRPKK